MCQWPFRGSTSRGTGAISLRGFSLPHIRPNRPHPLSLPPWLAREVHCLNDPKFKEFEPLVVATACRSKSSAIFLRILYAFLSLSHLPQAGLVLRLPSCHEPSDLGARSFVPYTGSSQLVAIPPSSANDCLRPIVVIISICRPLATRCSRPRLRYPPLWGGFPHGVRLRCRHQSVAA